MPTICITWTSSKGGTLFALWTIDEAWLTKWTEINEITHVPESLPRYAYRLKSFQSLLASAGDKTYLADVVGKVTGVSRAVTIDAKGHPVSKRTLRLTDAQFGFFPVVLLSRFTFISEFFLPARETATVALWSENAEAIDSEMLIDVESLWLPSSWDIPTRSRIAGGICSAG